MACCTLKPSGLVKMTPAPLACDVDDPSVNIVHALSENRGDALSPLHSHKLHSTIKSDMT